MQQIIYTIQPNDTLYKIAHLYGSTIDAIMDTNKITNPNLISPGTIILIPVEEEDIAALPGSLIYTVQPGDTLYIISLLFGVSSQSILKLNNIDNPSLIYPGMKIVMPKEARNPFQPIEPGLIKYTILPDDTIYKVAGRFAVSVQSILNVNPELDPLRLMPGKEILISIPKNAVAIYKGFPKKKVALTFDATYGDNNQVNKLLKTLSDNKIKATFFLSGIWLINFPPLVRAIAAEGHEIGNHSHTHPHMTLMSSAEVDNQVMRTDALISNISGSSPYLFRPPYGEYNQAMLNNISSLGYVSIMWTIDSLDWKSPGVDQITSRIVNNIEPGAIILMHQSSSQTSEALPDIIYKLKEKGYDFGTVTQLLNA
ncbi:MAG TPA: LysM peptidoglycan-binding domain-containing protein [Anaerovoracaceae bacterium]|nr:LysM peptidoglycan-binding domain-containing protein [Anaerovoracaceae bacterium]